MPLRSNGSRELAEAVILKQPPIFHPNTGENMAECESQGRGPTLHFAAKAGLDLPRYCQLCGRRMVAQVRPDGWTATCSRHGELDSSDLWEETMPPDHVD